MLQKFTIFFMFICQANVMTTLGVQYHSYVYLYLFLGMLLLFTSKAKDKGIEFSIFLLWGGMLAYRIYAGSFSESVQFSLNLLVPALLAMALPDTIYNRRILNLYKLAFTLLVIFAFLEVTIGLFEFITKTHVLVWIDNVYDSHISRVQTRPIGLVGASLGNSYALAALSLLILASPMKNKYKLYAWSFCFIGLIAYQGRMAILASMVGLLVFVAVQFKKGGITPPIFASIILLILAFVVVVFNTRLGERLLAKDDGGSAEMRFIAIKYFFSLNFKKFLLGLSLNQVHDVQALMQVKIIECAVIHQTLLFGFVFVIPFYYLYYKLYSRIRRGENSLTRISTISIFLLLENTGIGWFSGFYGVFIFFLTAKILSCCNLYYLLPRKYLIPKEM